MIGPDRKATAARKARGSSEFATRANPSALGVDPGQTGAAVLVDGDIVVLWWAWSKVAAGFRVTQLYGEDVVPSLYAVGFAIGRQLFSAVPRLIVERGYIGRRGSGKKASDATIVTSLENTGRLIAGFESAGLVLSARPTADDWRKAYGWTKLDAVRAEDAAIGMARREGWLPRLDSAAEQGALAEARRIAAYR